MFFMLFEKNTWTKYKVIGKSKHNFSTSEVLGGKSKHQSWQHQWCMAAFVDVSVKHSICLLFSELSMIITWTHLLTMVTTICIHLRTRDRHQKYFLYTRLGLDNWKIKSCICLILFYLGSVKIVWMEINIECHGINHGNWDDNDSTCIEVFLSV